MKDELRQKFRNGEYSMMGGVSSNGRVWTGALLLIIGLAALLKISNALPPEMNWVYDWPMILIVFGLFLGFKHNFRGGAWFVLLLIGGVFLVRNNFFKDVEIGPYIWPIVLIIIGLFFILRPKDRWHSACGQKKTSDPSAGNRSEAVFGTDASDSREDYVNATSVFGGTKKNILSKNFKGGEIVNIFGGTELNLSQADIIGEAVIETTTIFGGIKLVIPSNWTVKSDAAAIFGGIEDKRPASPVEDNNHRILRLKGTVVFGGVDIKSY